MARRPRPVGSAPRAAAPTSIAHDARNSTSSRTSSAPAAVAVRGIWRARRASTAARLRSCGHTRKSRCGARTRSPSRSHTPPRGGGGLRFRAALATPACQSAALQGAARSRKKRFTQSVVSAVRGGRGRHGPSTSVARCGTTPHTARSEDAGTSKYSSSGCAAHVTGVPKRGLLSTVLAASAGHLREGVCAIGDS